MESITIHPKNKEQANLFEQLAKTLKVPFEKSKKPERPYNAEFVSKIERSRQNYKEGKGEVVTLEELNKLWK
ncbi:MAG: hypothetical protein H0V14_03410 [Chitinophagaceae bacterium]|nr:hypothetical protein [Chitinophagaceae bacterium]